jgi:hypothetical protein
MPSPIPASCRSPAVTRPALSAAIRMLMRTTLSGPYKRDLSWLER